MKPCKKCQRGIHDEQLDANDGFCADCKTPIADVVKKSIPKDEPKA